MKLSALVLTASAAAVASAQGPTLNDTTGLWTCPTSDAVYCASNSLDTDIIINCKGLVGTSSSCINKLVGYPPYGSNPARCYSPSLGVAACLKNCYVYASTGNVPSDGLLSDCIPYSTDTNTTNGTTTTSATITAPHPTIITNSTTVPPHLTNTSSIVVTRTRTVSSLTRTTNIAPHANTTTIAPTTAPTANPTTSISPTLITVNGSVITVKPTPTTTNPVVVSPGAGTANAAGLGLVVLGLAVAFAV